MKKYRIALTGNPNCGKTTLFNALTGAKQTVGNWPGVTVERIEGNFTNNGNAYKIIDLPGIYSFSAYSIDEKVSREFILVEKPDLVINIIDATNLERTMYLTTQLLEMRIPIIVAINMMDLAKQQRIKIEIDHLAKHLGCPVIPIIATKKQGIDALVKALNENIDKHHVSNTQVQYDSVVETAIEKLIPLNEKIAQDKDVDPRWLSIKLLEQDPLALEMSNNNFKDCLEAESQKIKRHTHIETDIVIADGRYGFIHGLTKDVVHKTFEFRKNISDFIDKFVLNRFLSIPIFFLVMYLVFSLTIKIGSPFIDFFDAFSGTIFVDGFSQLLKTFNSPQWLIIFLAHGIGGGIQTISTFIPPVFFMFLSLSILEDSGYMSRAAFIMDKFMRLIGLPGKAFIPMLVGFGCNVPAILATRTLENRRDRLLTILINPFMSCGARLPVYALFASTFFGNNGGKIIFTLYITGIALAVLSGVVFKRTLFKGETSTFVMELPPYHIPTFNGIMMHTWQRLKGFVLRAGKIIIFFIIILSFLSSIGTDGSFSRSNLNNSILSHIGKKVTPIFHPLGIESDNWPATVGLITGIFAKETIVGTLNSLYADEINENETSDLNFWEKIGNAFSLIPDGFSPQETESQELNEDFKSTLFNKFKTRNRAFAYLLFVLIYMPCVGVVAAIYREVGMGWASFSVVYLTILAWIISTLYYQISIFHQQPSASALWIFISLFSLMVIYIIMKISGKNISIT